MASNQALKETAGKFVSPLDLKSRRDSLVSVSSKDPIDQQVLAQALDQVHSTARQSETLTSFDEFAPPPPPQNVNSNVEKGLTLQLTHSSLGNIYSRLKASVGPSREPPSSPSKVDQPTLGNKTPSDSITSYSQSAETPKTPLQADKSPEPESHPRSTISSLSHPEDVINTQFSRSPAASDSALVNRRPNEHDASSQDAVSFDAATPTATAAAFPPIDFTKSSGQFPQSDINFSSRKDSKLSTQTYDQAEGRVSFPGITLRTPSGSLFDSERPHENDLSKRKGLQRISEGAEKSEARIDAKYLTTNDQPVLRPKLLSPATQLPGFESRTTSSDDLRSQNSSLALTPYYEPTQQQLQAEFRFKPQVGRISAKDLMISQMRNKVLSRDFWMKDENAKVCFSCGEQFSTFRRKHHCRLCGQIFCASCTHLISGKPFGQASKLRTCKACEQVLNGEDSSDAASYSDEEYAASPHVRHLRFSEPSEMLLHKSSPLEHTVSLDSSRPGLPLSRTSSLARPSSSRSLKSLGSRPRSSSYRQRRSRHQHMRSLGLSAHTDELLAQDSRGNHSPENELPAFHTDSIVDPDLAPFLSDDGTSDDEPISIAGTLASEAQSPAPFNSGFSALKKSRSRPLSRGLLDSPRGFKDSDTLSISSSKAPHPRRLHQTRTLSMSSIGRHGTGSRIIRSENLFNQYHLRDGLGDMESKEWVETPIRPYDPSASVPDFRNPKDSTQRAAELSSASMEHVKKLLYQFFLDSDIQPQPYKWEKALLPILLRCAEDVDPNIQRGDDIDIRHYVKLKRAAGGNPSDTRYISGVVFTKNVALKEMPRSINHPRILLVAFPLVYARQQQHFMSLDPVIAQEREYLRNLVNRIIALRPHLLLVQRQVSGLALQFLQDAGVAVVCNVKDSVMHAVSRCAKTKIISSVEKLTMDPSGLGTSEKFEVKTYVHSGLRKSFIFISGCQPDLGCTIFIRGADHATLAKVKWIVEFMCYAVYNLKLETSVLRDQFVSLPANQHRSSTDPVAEDKTSEKQECGAVTRPSGGREVVTDMHLLSMASEGTQPPRGRKETPRGAGTASNHSQANRVEAPTTYTRLYQDLEKRALSVSPLVKLADPYLLLRGAELEVQMQQLLHLVNREDSMAKEQQPDDDVNAFKLIESTMVFESKASDSPQIREALRAIHSAEYEKVSHRYSMLKRRWETYISGVVNPFSPLTHQRIVVLFSLVSTSSNDSCEGPDLLGMDYYREHDIDSSMEPDVPLGEYIERIVHQAKAPCLAKRCERNMMSHHRQYVHGKGQIRVFIESQKSKVRGMESTILMWSVCRICDHETQVVPMSSGSWKYSFAKYLELSFWSDPTVPRAGSCSHDVHRDHFRYFGLNNLAIKVQYDSINIVEVIVPRLQVTWKVEKDLTLKNDQYTKAEERISKFIASVKHRLKSIKTSSIVPGKEDACKTEIDRLTKLADSDRRFLVEKLRQKYMTSKYFEIIPFNRAIRAMQEKVAEWDQEFTAFEQEFFPSEKDLSKLAAAQLSRVYLGGEDPQDSPSSEQQSNEKRVDVHLISPGVDEKSGLISAGGGSPLSSALPSPARVISNSDSPLSELSTIYRTQDVVDKLDLAVQNPPVSSPAEGVSADYVDQALLPTHIEEGEDESQAKSVEGSNNRETKSPTLSQDVPQSSENSTSKGIDRTGNESGIPRYVKQRQPRVASPPLVRSKTQPTMQTRPTSNQGADNSAETSGTKSPQTSDAKSPAPAKSTTEKKLSDRLGLSGARAKILSQSMIPRSIPQNRFQSKVSSLAKHFEQLSREFEKERIKERRQRAAKNKHSTFYPVASSNPVVEVFKSAYEAVQEQESHGVELTTKEPKILDNDKSTTEQSIKTPEADLPMKPEEAKPLQHGSNRSPENPMEKNYAESVAETVQSEELVWDPTITGEMGLISPAETEGDFASELPKHEKSSLLKLLTSFWSERSASEWSALDYPLVAGDHIFADSDILVREDEPSSLVAFSIASQDYVEKLQGFRERVRDATRNSRAAREQEGSASDDVDVEQTMLGKTATHMKYQFQAGSARMQCKIFYAESFDAIRRKCGVADRFVESLSRCYKWDSKGGKTKSLFLKTLDERFILKSLSAIETQSFLKFAPDYFDYTSRCLFHNLPSALAKIMGLYQVVIKNPATGIECNEFLLVMENVFYEGPSNRMFDLKGSMRNRKVQSTGERDEVLLDENLLDYISQNPVYVQNHSNSTLASSISNDTLFCSKQNVMDYSLIVGLYDDRKELLVGIIDYIRTYTWDKRLESWIKDRGKNKPTVRSPKDYRNRFRASIPRYFPLAPSCWQAFGQQRYDLPGLTWDAPPRAAGVQTELDDMSEEDMVVSIK